MAKRDNLKRALKVLAALDLPRAQQNERSALCLLALLNLTPEKTWAQAESPLVGITPMMEFARKHYGKDYAPNTRETVRRQTIHQFVQAAVATYNPDKPDRPVNSPKAVYQIMPETLALLKTYGTKRWAAGLKTFLAVGETLAQRYAKERVQSLVPVQIAAGQEIKISPGDHSLLIKAIVEEFAPRFAPGCDLVYVGDTGEKWGYFDEKLLAKLGVRANLTAKCRTWFFSAPIKTGFCLLSP